MSPSDWWLETSTAALSQGMCFRPSTRSRQKGLLQKKSWPQKQVYMWRMRPLGSNWGNQPDDDGDEAERMQPRAR